MEEVSPLLYRGVLRSLFVLLQQYVGKSDNAECKIIRLGADETYLDGLADPMLAMDTECPYLGPPCCLALAVLPLPKLDL